jgi:predicted CoA-substrate-specific enzyme activase
MDDIAMIVATGYGRGNIDFADDSITEITCHARGAFHLNKDVRTIIDIGGQDSKAISIDESGNVKNFAMNDKCAAGTGRFLENMAKVLETDLDGISEAGLKWNEDITISSMCTVFAESEVVSLIADNRQISDIVHGLNKSVASKTMALVNRVGAESRYMMTGGGARNKGVVGCIEELIGEKVFVPEMPDLCGAIGAALFAMDSAGQEDK